MPYFSHCSELVLKRAIRTSCTVCFLGQASFWFGSFFVMRQEHQKGAIFFFFFLFLPCCSLERPLCVCNVSCSLLPPMAILFVRDQPGAAPVWNSYWRVTADKRNWHKSPQRILSKNLGHTETLSLRRGQRGVEPVPTLVYPQLRSLAVVRLSLPPQSDSLMGFYASLAFSPPPCFTYTPSQSRKKRNETE